MKKVIKNQKKMKNTMYIVFGVFALALFAITRINPSYADDGLNIDDALDAIVLYGEVDQVNEEENEVAEIQKEEESNQEEDSEIIETGREGKENSQEINNEIEDQETGDETDNYISEGDNGDQEENKDNKEKLEESTNNSEDNQENENKEDEEKIESGENNTNEENGVSNEEEDNGKEKELEEENNKEENQYEEIQQDIDLLIGDFQKSEELQLQDFTPTASKYQTIYITGADGTVIQTNNQEWEDLNIYFLKTNGSIGNYTLMDRNLGATAVYNKNWSSANKASFGYYYRWGNNKGFVDKDPDLVDASVGNWDEGEQGPCPTDYHVPTYTELYDIYRDSRNLANNQNNAIEFASQFLLPPVGSYNDYYGYAIWTNQRAFYYSSTSGSNDTAVSLRLWPSDSNRIDVSYFNIGGAHSVRCFKNTYDEISIDANGGTGAMISFTGTVGSGIFIALGSPTKGTYTFLGRYDAAEGGNKIETGDTVVSHLYARWGCPTGKIDNGEVCIRKAEDFNPTTSKYETIYITGTDGTIIQTNNQEWEDLELYFLSSTGEVSHYTIMDRNLGAVDVYNKQWGAENVNEESYGYYYARGNNAGYGKDDPNLVSSSHGERTGGEGGPCPTGYHIPTKDELQEMESSWESAKNNLNNKGILLALDWLLPPAGIWNYFTNKEVTDYGSEGLYFTSSKYYTSNGDRVNELLFTGSSINTEAGALITYVKAPLRCVKNLQNNALTIHLNGGVGGVVGFTGTVGSGIFTTLDEPKKEGYNFYGWYDAEEGGNKIETGDTVVSNLYAIWGCLIGQTDNGEECVEKAEDFNPTTSKYETIYITGTDGTIIQTNNQEWEDLELYFLSSTGEVSHYTIMDRNLGAREPYNQQIVRDSSVINTGSFGYNYQWGNNYGFEPCINNPLTDNSCTEFTNNSGFVTTIPYEIWNAYSPSKYARNTWSTSHNWMGGTNTQNLNANIWGGGLDTSGSNHDGTIIGSSNEWSILSGRQGPCPKNYYIPSIYDWQMIYDKWNTSRNLTNEDVGAQLASDLLLPPAGDRTLNNNVGSQGAFGYYWSSSVGPGGFNYAGYFSFSLSYISPQVYNYRSLGETIRCAKGSPNTKNFTLHANGGNRAVIAFTGKVGDGVFTTLGTPTRGIDTFVGWYDAEEGGNKIETGDTVVSDLYARWGCPTGYINNGTRCIVAPTSTKYETIYITGTNGTVIQENNQEWEDLELYFLQSNGILSHYTIMDRNLGATESYNQNFSTSTINTQSFGYQYQWGNNYGFKPCISLGSNCSSLPGGESYTSSISSSWKNYRPSQYSNNTRSTSSNWMYQSTTGDNIRGGGGDTPGLNHDGILIGNNNGNILSGRQGPCPDGYYIPSTYDWSILKNARGNSTLSSSDGIQLSYDLLLPPAGYRDYNRSVYSQGSYGYYWSSSPEISYNYDSYYLYFYSSYIDPQNYNYRSRGASVRCAKNSVNTQNFTVHANGGKTIIAFTGTVGSGKFTSLGIPTANGANFVGWYSTPDFQTGTEIKKGDTVVSDLYAKWECKLGYKENENNTGCEIEDPFYVNYNPNGGFFSGMNVNEVKQVRYSFDGTKIIPVYNIQIPNKSATGQTGWMFAGRYTKSGENNDRGEEFDIDTAERNIAYAKWLPFMDLKFEMGGKTLILMDRNLGAESVANGIYGNNESLDKLGFYYQWGNNYGFKNSGILKSSSDKVDGDSYGPGNFYYSNIYRTISGNPARWTINNNENLWGGDSYTDIDKQGPCPKGYHIPNNNERSYVVSSFNSRKNDTIEGQNYCSVFGTNYGKCLASKLKLPFAGYRSNSSNSSIYNKGGQSYYWSVTSPYDNDSNYRGGRAGLFMIDSSSFAAGWIGPRSAGRPVRCLKNSGKPIIFNTNGGSAVQNANTIRWYESSPSNLSNPTHPDFHMEFNGWYTTPNFEKGTQVMNNNITGDQSSDVINLYAKWECEEGYNKVGNSCEGPAIAILLNGMTFNTTLKTLAKGESVTSYQSGDDLIKGFVWSGSMPAESVNKVKISIDNSEVPVWAWFDGVSGIVYYHSDTEKIYLNPDSNFMFSYFSGLTSLNLSNLNPKKVNGIYYFIGSSSVKNLNLDNWDVRTSGLGCMFQDANSLRNLSLKKWKIPQIFQSMIGSRSTCLSAPLDSVDVSDWDLSNTWDILGLFGNLNTKSIEGLDTWDTSNITNMSNMFGSISNLTGLNLSGWDTSNVTTMAGMFVGDSSLEQINLKNFDTSKVENMSSMFNGCNNLENLDLSHFDTSKVTTMSYMFQQCNKLDNLDLSHFDTSNVTDVSSMFNGCNNLKSLNLDNWDFLKINGSSSMSSMFSNLTSIEKLSAKNWKIPVEFMDIFGERTTDFGSESIQEIDVSNWDLSKTKNLYGLFADSNVRIIKGLDTWDTSSITNMTNMFGNLKNLSGLDLSSWDTSNVVGMDRMFLDATGLKTIYASDNFKTTKLSPNKNMFSGAINIVGGNGTTYDENHLDKQYARIDTPIQSGYFTRAYSIVYNLDGGEIEGEKNSYTPLQMTYKLPIPTKENAIFIGWTGGNGLEPEIDVEIKEGTTGNLEFTANWKIKGQEKETGESGNSSGGGGKKESSHETETHGSSDIKADIDENLDEKSEKKQEDSSTNSIEGENNKDFGDKSTGGQGNIVNYNEKYTQEETQAYEFAKTNGITTTSSIEKAKMNTTLKRIEMAKMLSNYAINILGQEPDSSKGTVKFNDVSSNMDKQYDNGVTLAYQLGIMGQNMKDNKFRPNDEVTRAEFVTALSRLLYNTDEGKYKSTGKYYEPHMAKLYNEGIISNTNPNLKEKRGYVMLMLMRSVK